MPHKLIKAVFLACILLVGFSFWRCANPVPPKGGPEDFQPPRIVTEKSTPNHSTNFKGKEIRITFDEWVQVNDVFNQVVVSPPQDEQPEVRLKGKTVILTFKDSLRANTTYNIFFGEAVKDITRNNPAKELRYVISTGPYLDSLSVRGGVADAQTGDLMKDVFVMLYRDTRDSIVFNQKPDYFAKTNEGGAFNIDFIGAGEYKIFALKDNNFNYRYDLDNELIGFIPDLVSISDSTNPSINLLMFQEKSGFRLLKTNSENYGKVRFDFNSLPKDLSFEVVGNKGDFDFIKEENDNAVTLWYDAPTLDSVGFRLVKSGESIDTIKLKFSSRDAFLKGKASIFALAEPDPENEKPSAGKRGANLGKSKEVDKKATAFYVNPHKDFYIDFNYPITSFKAGDMVLEDTTGSSYSPTVSKVEGHPRRLIFKHIWTIGTYTLKIPKASLSTLLPISNEDLSFKLIAKDPKKYGNLQTKIYGLEPSENYIVELMQGKEKTINTYFVTGLDSTKRDYLGLEPSSYQLRITEDKNNNKEWDPGNYLGKTMPERIIVKSLPSLKPNWDVEGIVNLNDSAKKPKPGKKSLPK